MLTQSGHPHAENKPKKFLDVFADDMRIRNYARRTIEAYIFWIKQYILFHGKKHPKEMGAAQIKSHLTHLAVEKDVAAGTQNQAFKSKYQTGGHAPWAMSFTSDFEY